jgi:RNA polymerase sigma factor FliA
MIMKRVKDLVFDFKVFPRQEINWDHVQRIVDAMQDGTDFPPIIICRDSHRIVDGFHRTKAVDKITAGTGEIRCIEKAYASEQEFFLDAIRYNSEHGLSLTSQDRLKAIGLSESLKIDPAKVAKAMRMSIASIGKLKIAPVMSELTVGGAEHRSEAKKRIMEQFIPLVRTQAELRMAKLPPHAICEVDDLVAAGMVGLSDAIRGFDGSRDIKFETYAVQRIKGSILDYLRQNDWVPRLERQRGNATPLIESMEHPYEDGNGLEKSVHVLEQSSEAAPGAEMEASDLIEKATSFCDKTEKFIILGYYTDGLTMKQIGESLGVSESRVSQLHSSVLARMKVRMNVCPVNLELLADWLGYGMLPDDVDTVDQLRRIKEILEGMEI